MAAPGQLSPVAVQQFFDNSGRPLAGGSLSLYLAGTSTPSPAYADRNLTTPLTNPIVLDSAGRAPMLWLDQVAYKQILKDALGVTLWSADNITAALGQPLPGDGVIANLNADKLDGMDSTRFYRAMITSNAVGTQHNFNPAPGIVLGQDTYIALTNLTALTVTGLPQGIAGQRIMLRATSSDVFLPHNNAGSTFKFINSATSGTTPISTGGWAEYTYHDLGGGTGSWVMTGHEPGQWIAAPYNAVYFSGSGSMTWAVSAGNMSTFRYRLQAKTLSIVVDIQGTTIGGTPSTDLLLSNNLYGGFTGGPGPTMYGGRVGRSTDGGGAVVESTFVLGSSAATIRIVKTSFAAWTAGANASVSGFSTFEVT
jgi:hypothetical protein